MVHHHILECRAERLGSHLQGQGQIAGSNPNFFVTVSSISIFEPFVTKFGIKVCYRTPECCMTILDCCLQGQGHSEGPNHRGTFVLGDTF